jgi:hypothetical protein
MLADLLAMGRETLRDLHDHQTVFDDVSEHAEYSDPVRGTGPSTTCGIGCRSPSPRELSLGEIVAEATLDAVEPDENGVPVDEPARQVRAASRAG